MTKRWWGALTAAVLTGATLVVAPLVTGGGAPSASAATAATTWMVATTPTFSDPTGTPAQRDRVVDRINDAIIHAPHGSTIRFATYSFDLSGVAGHLMSAHKRSVHIQIVVNSSYVSSVERKLQQSLGTNTSRTSFLKICQGSCRGAASSTTGNEHIKFFTFTQSGASKDVIIDSSGNLSLGAEHSQWNDAYTIVGNTALWNSWITEFNQLKADRKATPRLITTSNNQITQTFQRTSASAGATATSSDRVIARLQLIGCTAPKGYGSGGRTVVHIDMRAWYGTRGDKIATEVAQLKKKGCKITVIGSSMGPSVLKKLRSVGIGVRAADWDWGEGVSPVDGKSIVYQASCYSHLKFWTVNGAYNGKGTRSIWTGSENWSAPSLSNDEVQIRSEKLTDFRSYETQFRSMWNAPNVTHAAGIQPTRRTCA